LTISPPTNPVAPVTKYFAIPRRTLYYATDDADDAAAKITD
jgi:hypothetical protein